MKTFIKIVLLSFLFFISFSGQSQAQSGKGAYGNTISRRSGSQQTDYITRGLRFNADVCAGSNLDAGDVNVTAGVGYQFSPYVYLGGVIGSGYNGYGPKGIVAADCRMYFMKSVFLQCCLHNLGICSVQILMMDIRGIVIIWYMLLVVLALAFI